MWPAPLQVPIWRPFLNPQKECLEGHGAWSKKSQDPVRKSSVTVNRNGWIFSSLSSHEFTAELTRQLPDFWNWKIGADLPQLSYSCCRDFRICNKICFPVFSESPNFRNCFQKRSGCWSCRTSGIQKKWNHSSKGIRNFERTFSSLLEQIGAFPPFLVVNVFHF